MKRPPALIPLPRLSFFGTFDSGLASRRSLLSPIGFRRYPLSTEFSCSRVDGSSKMEVLMHSSPLTTPPIQNSSPTHPTRRRETPPNLSSKDTSLRVASPLETGHV